jgi:hypothetical protein
MNSGKRLSLLTVDHPFGQRSHEMEHPLPQYPRSLPDVRHVLATMADAASAMATILDSLRETEFTEISDLDIAANLRVELDQAAAAADDLRQSLSNATDTSAASL